MYILGFVAFGVGVALAGLTAVVDYFLRRRRR